jgi:hypothetical protein
VIVAVISVRVMEVTADQVVHVVAVRHLGMTTSWSMDMPLLVSAANMAGRASFRIGCRYFQHALIDVIAVHMMHVTIVQIVRVPVVSDRGMAAPRSVLMFVAFDWIASAHRECSLCQFRLLHRIRLNAKGIFPRQRALSIAIFLRGRSFRLLGLLTAPIE